MVGQLPTPNSPTAALVYTLGWRGRKALLAAGESVPDYYRPSEVGDAGTNPAFMPHTLAVIDVLIAAERFAGSTPDVHLAKLQLERDLRRLRLRVNVPAAGARLQERVVTVVPDALFSLDVAGERQDFVVELDRGTERRQKWRDKAAALVAWITSPESKTLLSGDDVTVLVVTESPGRRDDLLAWTRQELADLDLLKRCADGFVVTCASPVVLSPEAFFTLPHWYPVDTGAPESLFATDEEED